jgi:hypothetical protein
MEQDLAALFLVNCFKNKIIAPPLPIILVLIREFSLVTVLYYIKSNPSDGYVSAAECFAGTLKFLMLISFIGGYIH